ncbi:MAG TPA: hypothetical protein VJO33_18715, partial [Gemmatimonadaceae bacterium]|nr:hypothetical protein [Gemmatimonadaceae bacterium]
MTRFLEATRERFLLAIAATLPAERFIELHFFSPIRQGGVESGVAVIAAHPDPVLSSEAPPVIPSEARDLLLDSGEANGSAREQRARLRISSSASSESEK